MDTLGFWSLVPPIVAVILAFATREIILSLTAGIVSGGVVAVLCRGQSLLHVPTLLLDITSAYLAENIHMVIFLFMLGALVAVVSAAGGAQAYGEWAYAHIRQRRSANLLTALLGVIIFIDDYFNCLMVGTVMRPVTDKFRISREKLAYLIDATSAPVCILAPISSWAAYVVSCLPDDWQARGMSLFMQSMPFNFYAIGTLILVFATCLWQKLEFGPMRDAERVTRAGHDVGADRKAIGLAAVPVVGKGHVFDLVLPITALIVFSILALRAMPGENAARPLSIASFGAMVFAFLLFVPRGLVKFRDFSNVMILGMKTMVPAVEMLTLAWTISGICDEELGTGRYISSLLARGTFPMWCLPAAFFLTSALLAFATGASWGAIGILVPVAAETGALTTGVTGVALLLGAVLAGAVQGDHCSPIADTTILSSTGAGCRHHNHVVTQLPYSLAVGVVALVAYLVAGFAVLH